MIISPKYSKEYLQYNINKCVNNLQHYDVDTTENILIASNHIMIDFLYTAYLGQYGKDSFTATLPDAMNKIPTLNTILLISPINN